MSDDLLRQFQSLLSEQASGETGTSIEALLRSMAPEAAEHLRLCAIPHEFSPRALRILDPGLDEGGAQAQFEEFSQLSCVIVVPDGLALHDATRAELFGQWLTPARRAKFREASARLVAFYRDAATAATGSARETTTHSRVFHLLGADLEQGFAEFESLCRRSRHEARWTACANLIRLVHEYDPLLTPVQTAWLAYHEGKLAIDIGQTERAEELLAPIAKDQAAPPSLVVRAALRLGYLAAQQGTGDAAIEHYLFARDVVEKYRPAGIAMYDVLRSLGEAYRDRGDYDRAAELLDTSLESARQANDQGALADTYNSLGTLHWRQHDVPEAAAAYRTSLEILQRLGRHVQSAQVFNNLGMVYAEQRDWAKAAEFYEKSLDVKRQIGDSLGQARTLVNLVQVHRGRNQVGTAITTCTKAIELFASVRNTLGSARAKRMLGRLYVEHGAAQEATSALHEAAELFVRAGATAEARDTEREVASIGRREGIPWWAWLTIAILGLALIGVLIAVIVLIALK